jgi:hypothetical protein
MRHANAGLLQLQLNTTEMLIDPPLTSHCPAGQSNTEILLVSLLAAATA